MTQFQENLYFKAEFNGRMHTDISKEPFNVLRRMSKTDDINASTRSYFYYKKNMKKKKIPKWQKYICYKESWRRNKIILNALYLIFINTTIFEQNILNKSFCKWLEKACKETAYLKMAKQYISMVFLHFSRNI